MVPEIRNYTIHGEIGAGGMAVVYEATDNRLQRTVAIKVLHPHLCREPLASGRFVREARAAAKIDHPNVVRLYDYCAEDDLHYIVMEYVLGITLDRSQSGTPYRNKQPPVAVVCSCALSSARK